MSARRLNPGARTRARIRAAFAVLVAVIVVVTLVLLATDARQSRQSRDDAARRLDEAAKTLDKAESANKSLADLLRQQSADRAKADRAETAKINALTKALRAAGVDPSKVPGATGPGTGSSGSSGSGSTGSGGSTGGGAGGSTPSPSPSTHCILVDPITGVCLITGGGLLG